jgi:hypothetical protein
MNQARFESRSRIPDGLGHFSAWQIGCDYGQ